MTNYQNGGYQQNGVPQQPMPNRNGAQQRMSNAPMPQNAPQQRMSNSPMQQNSNYHQQNGSYPQQNANNAPAQQRGRQNATYNNAVFYSDQIVQLASKGKFLEFCDALNFASDQFFCHIHGEGGNRENNKFTGFPSSIKLRITDYSDKSAKAKVVAANIAPYVVDMIKEVCINNLDPFHNCPNNIWEYSQTRPNPYARRQDGRILVTQLKITYTPFILRPNFAPELKKRAWDIAVKTFWATAMPNKTPPYDKNSACDTATSNFSCTNEEMYKAVFTVQRFISMWENAHLAEFIRNMNAKRSQTEQRYAQQQNQNNYTYGRNTARSRD